MSPESLTFSISQSTLLDGNRDSMEKEKIETTVQTKPILFPLNLGFEHILLLLPLCLQILYFQNSLGVSGRLFYSLQYCNIAILGGIPKKCYPKAQNLNQLISTSTSLHNHLFPLCQVHVKVLKCPDFVINFYPLQPLCLLGVDYISNVSKLSSFASK